MKVFVPYFFAARTLGKILLVTLFVCSCKPESNVDPVKQGQDQLSSLGLTIDDQLAEWRDEPQQFTISGNEASQVSGLKGTQIFVNPEDLQLVSGEPLPSEILLELIELPRASEMAVYGIQSLADNKILNSGGVYYINLKSGDNEVMLKPGKKLKVQFPRYSEQEMVVFYGERDSSNLMNWFPTEIKLVKEVLPENGNLSGKIASDTSKSSYENLVKRLGKLRDSLQGHPDSTVFPSTCNDSLILEEEWRLISKSRMGLYEAIQIDQFGWVNCGRIRKDKTNTFAFSLNSPNELVQSCAWFLLPESNSIIGPVMLGNGNDIQEVIIPQNQSVKAVFYGFSADGKLFSAEKAFISGKLSFIEATMLETADADVFQMITRPLAL